MALARPGFASVAPSPQDQDTGSTPASLLVPARSNFPKVTDEASVCVLALTPPAMAASKSDKVTYASDCAAVCACPACAKAKAEPSSPKPEQEAKAKSAKAIAAAARDFALFIVFFKLIAFIVSS